MWVGLEFCQFLSYLDMPCHYGIIKKIWLIRAWSHASTCHWACQYCMFACLENASLSVFVRFRHLFWNKNVILGLMRMMKHHYSHRYISMFCKTNFITALLFVLPSSVVLKHAQAVLLSPFCYFQTKVLYMNFK
jgi:hypothetical protein